ncbi:tetratricopeptide repeat domain 39B [Trypanosoma theileri]|uniref:Tetratricopeptide repeat domain 39B n=1 Tax=Trypanosoma theileri TaxID=67003 RepID=A0A1X0P173_9TRYP|nr:tetratricopeptide repeat domain 39B [Trypanosoma theileri]ORC90684.1 tetratricopeptide repeat domain 39B [Trypanosoma theileri]
MSKEGTPMSSDGHGLHSQIEDAVHMMWTNRYPEAEALLSVHKNIHPRYALEYANCFLVQTLMNSTNESREALLDLFKLADSRATAAKYSEPMFFIDDDSDDIGNGDNSSAGGRSNELSSNSSITHTGGAERKKKKKAFKGRRKAAEKAGEHFDESWQLECDVVYADALLMRSVCQLMMNSYLKGGINLRRTWGIYHRLIQIVEADTANRIPNEIKMCIKYGTGTFYAFLALVPANLMKLLNVIGFISDKELGEQYLTEVFENNGIRSPFAALVLCTLYLFLPTGIGRVEETLQKAKHILNTMNQRYPENTYFHGYSNFYHRKRGETAEALIAIEKAARNAERAGLVPLLIRYLHADTLFMDLRYAEAKEKYAALLNHLGKTKETFAYTGQVVLSLAACYVMLGDDVTASSWLKKVGSMYNPRSKNDANSPKFAARVVSNNRLLPLCGVYMLYINRDLAHMNVEQAERVLSELKRVTEGKDLSGPEPENMYLLFVGVIQKGCDRIDEALQTMGKILANEKRIPSDSMVLPYTYYETGEMEYRRGNLERAKVLFTKGQSIKGDGNETLANRYNIALKQLKRAMSDKK